jgi:hypothetical protein
MSEELFKMEGSEARVTKIPNLRIGSQKDLTKSDSSVKISLGGVRGAQKEEIRSQNSYQPRVDDRGTKLAEKLVALNQRNKANGPSLPSNSPTQSIGANENIKSIGTIIIVGALLSGFLLGRWSTKIQFSIGE